VSEDPRVRIPTAVGYDGYVISYTAEPVEIPEQSLVDDWLPPNKAMPDLMPDNFNMMRFMGQMMKTMGMTGDPQDGWKNHHDAIMGAEAVIKETMDSFEKTFGRRYGNGMIEPYMMEGAEAAIVAMGSIAGSAKSAVEKLQNDGKKVGLVKLRSFIPFPNTDFKEIAENVGAFGVVDRSICPGKGGPVYNKLRSTLYDVENRPNVLQYHAGLGGKEVTVDNLYKVGEKTLESAGKKLPDTSVEWV
jgi:pyruvate ferredoxin oxidoreductase alpha subunit